MAEAGPNRTQQRTNFFCYTCNARFRRGHIQQDEFTCPTCGGGFVEELPEEEFQSSSGGNPIHDTAAALVSTILGGHSQEPSRGGGQFFDLLFSGGFPGLSSNSAGSGMMRGNPNIRQTATGISIMMTPHSHGGSNDPADSMDQMLQSFLTNLFVSLGGQPATGANIFGNVGDYVWGRDGLDAIVTQLMNQMEGTGPPPLQEDKMNRLKKININEEQVKASLDCKICWENFNLDEEVIQLDCDHLYHPQCIFPWLKLHGTCPICRRDFTDTEEVNMEQRDTSSSGQSSTPSTTTPLPFPMNLMQGGSSSSTSGSVPPNTNPGNDSNSTQNRFDDMEMDFD